MRDDQRARYARHLRLPELGFDGQRALLDATARIAIDEPAAVIAADYLAAGGVGALAITGGSTATHASIAAHGPDVRIDVTAGVADVTPAGPATAHRVELPEPPPWWPSAPGDATALASWRGATAAIAWIAETVRR